MERLLLEGATVLTSRRQSVADVLVVGDRVEDVLTPSGENQEVRAGARAIDLSGLVLGPGLVDLHVHLREPGQEWKEDIASGSRAAAAGGYTAVVAMPNTDPPLDAGYQARYIADRGRQVGLVEVIPAGCITMGMEGKRLSHLDDLLAAGVRIFSDDGLTVTDSGLLRRAMEYVGSRGGVICQHAEDPGLAAGGHLHEGRVSSLLGMTGIPTQAETTVVARDLALAELTGAAYHVQHVSCGETVALIRSARERGVKVTAEVAPHHLVFTESEVLKMDSVAKMYPPLRTEADVKALTQALLEGDIDAVATDHAPHAAHEKDVPFEEAPKGVIGLETAFSAVCSVLGGPALRTVFERMSVAPARIASLERHGNWIEPGIPANLVAVDPNQPWIPQRYRSKSTNSLFTGVPLVGQVRLTIHDGRITYDASRVADPDEEGSP
ncbi:MAG: dihydroorotase [bacterium]|nr:dihydroorotase [bacterium]MDE0642782.1 dihydroorotase [bacterium]MXX64234.1 dihydroorotase [Acidimicrobiia bacterium]MYD04458.1 dihydroorotase [Acidimicrobiia bacterium]